MKIFQENLRINIVFRKWGEWSSELSCCGQIRRFLIQTPLGTSLGLWTQPSSKVSAES